MIGKQSADGKIVATLETAARLRRQREADDLLAALEEPSQWSFNGRRVIDMTYDQASGVITFAFDENDGPDPSTHRCCFGPDKFPYNLADYEFRVTERDGAGKVRAIEIWRRAYTDYANGYGTFWDVDYPARLAKTMTRVAGPASS